MIALVLTFVLTLGVSALAEESRSENIDVTYRGIKVVVDGKEVTLRDPHGNVVEPFIYNGSIYIPVQTLEDELHEPIKWDGKNNTLYIGTSFGEAANILDVCPPYQASEEYNTPETVTIMGIAYSHAFTLSPRQFEAQWLYNLNGEFSTFSFDLGHVDGEYMTNAVIKIYLDDELVETIDATADMRLTHYEIPLKHALQMKLVSSTDEFWGAVYGFINATLE